MGKILKHVAPMNNEDMKALRDGFGEGIMHLGENDPKRCCTMRRPF